MLLPLTKLYAAGGFEKTDADWTAFFSGVGMIRHWTMILCVLIGPWQFVPVLYRNFRTVHFALGNVYVMLSLLLAAPSWAVMSFSFSSWSAKIIGLVVGIVWWVSTRKGIFYIAERNWLAHAKWMMYSYAIVLSAALISFAYDPASAEFQLVLIAPVISWLAVVSLKCLKVPEKLLQRFHS